jgi:hypothetical protein
MAMLTIDTVEIQNPSEYNVTPNELDSENTNRAEDGILQRDRIRAKVYRIDATWIGLTKAQVKAITDAIGPVSFSVVFYDPTESTDTTATMYSGDKKTTLSLYKSEAGESYWDFTCALIEY